MSTAVAEIQAMPSGLEVWNPKTINSNLALLQQAMKEVMVKDVDYGLIPGVAKPSLLQPGGQIIAIMFRLAPEIANEDVEHHEAGHRTVHFTTRLVHIPTGQVWGHAVGSCSTLETRYRYRNAAAHLTDRPVPKEYWDARKAGQMDRMVNIIGKGMTTKKGEDGIWYIAEPSGEKVENPDIADVYNTTRKIGFKRSFVGNVLMVTGASRIFTQDVEDFMNVDFEIPDPSSTVRKEETAQRAPDKAQRPAAAAAATTQRPAGNGAPRQAAPTTRPQGPPRGTRPASEVKTAGRPGPPPPAQKPIGDTAMEIERLMNMAVRFEIKGRERIEVTYPDNSTEMEDHDVVYLTYPEVEQLAERLSLPKRAYRGQPPFVADVDFPNPGAIRSFANKLGEIYERLQQQNDLNFK